MDVNETDFETQVVARSAGLPVVVDFWAPWCGPCRVLGPALEAEVEALDGRAALVKVNIDDNPGLAGRFAVRAIPAVKAFRDGRVVAEFEGARDRGFVRRWLADLAPSPGREALERAAGARRAGDLDAAEAALRPLLDDAEVGRAAATALVELLLDRGAVAGAAELLPRVDPERADLLERRLALLSDAQAYGGEDAARAALARDPDDLEARWALACALVARAAWGEALEALIAVVAASRAFRDDGARRAMVTIFEILGPGSDLARDYRRRLQILT